LLASANKKPDDLADIGFAEDMKDLPMFRESNSRSGGGLVEESKEVDISANTLNKPRYTVAYKKMD